MALNVNSNIPGLSANRMLLGASRGSMKAMQKLSSGLKINTGADSPAGLIISELLRGQVNGISQAVRNTQEANNVLGIAEGGLQEVSSQLLKMRELALHSLNSGITSPAQTSANQAELNSSLETISRIAATTRYSDQNLLDGSRAISYTANDPDNMIDLAATRIDVAGDVPGQSAAVAFSGNAAEQAERAVLETDFGTGATTFASDQTFTVAGNEGSTQFSFSAGTSIEDAVDQINLRSASTGVEAYAIKDQGSGATEVRLASAGYGEQEYVQVEQKTGDAFAAEGVVERDAGQNATVNVGGETLQTDGLVANVQSASVNGSLALREEAIAQTGYDQDTLVDATTAVSAEFNDIEGGMRFQLGEGAGVQNRERFSLDSMNPINLGRVEVNGETFSLSDLTGGGAASLATNPEAAIQVIDQAIADVASTRARIGAYQANTLETNINSLSVALENITATESAIRDTDMAAASTEQVRQQLLMRVGLMGVQSANVQAESVLKLLGG